MTEYLDGSRVEHIQTAQHVAGSDSRHVIDAANEHDALAKDRSAQHEYLRGLWDRSGISRDFGELSEILGTRFIESKVHEFRGPMSWMSPLTMRRPIRLGARVRDAEKIFDISEGGNVASLTGSILFYRTDVGDEQYHENGFFTLAVMPLATPEAPTPAPYYTWGDIDAAQWHSEGWKIQLEKSLSRQPDSQNGAGLSARLFYQRYMEQRLSTKEFLDSLLGNQRVGVIRKRDKVGVLRQNQTPCIDDEQDFELVRTQLRDDMQAFIDRVYEPLQTSPRVIDASREAVSDALDMHDLAPLVVSDFDVAKAIVKHRTSRQPRTRKNGIITPTGLPDGLSWQTQLPPLSSYPGVLAKIEEYEAKRKRDEWASRGILGAMLAVDYDDIEYEIYRELRPAALGLVFPFD